MTAPAGSCPQHTALSSSTHARVLHAQDTGLLARLQAVKRVFCEPRAAGDAFDLAIRRYYACVDEGGGALFMAVCRGKVRRAASARVVMGRLSVLVQQAHATRSWCAAATTCHM